LLVEYTVFRATDKLQAAQLFKLHSHWQWYEDVCHCLCHEHIQGQHR